jgi:hypothetical protein
MVGHVDLAALKLTDDEAAELQEALELQRGMRCHGCGRRITIGMKFTQINVRQEPPVRQVVGCTRDDCSFIERCRDSGATVMEMIEFAWTDEHGADAPAARSITRRNEQWAAHAAADDEAEAATDG